MAKYIIIIEDVDNHAVNCQIIHAEKIGDNPTTQTLAGKMANAVQLQFDGLFAASAKDRVNEEQAARCWH